MKLQIVKTNQGYVAISDEKPYQKDTKTKDESKWALLLFDSWVGRLSMEYRGLWRIEWKVSDSVGNLLSDPHQPENYRMIVATDTSFKLEGIPQFELPAVLTGAESTEEKGCYSIEDMRKAYEAGNDRGFWEEDYKDGSKILEQNAPKFEVFIASLNQPKKLVAIEVETEIVSKTKVWETGNTSAWQESIPKANDGLLTIQKYYYEMH